MKGRLLLDKERRMKKRGGGSADGEQERERSTYRRTKSARTTGSREPTLISPGRDKRNEQVTSNLTLTSLFLFIGASKGLITSTTPLSPGRPCTQLGGGGRLATLRSRRAPTCPFQPSCPCLRLPRFRLEWLLSSFALPANFISSCCLKSWFACLGTPSSCLTLPWFAFAPLVAALPFPVPSFSPSGSVLAVCF